MDLPTHNAIVTTRIITYQKPFIRHEGILSWGISKKMHENHLNTCAKTSKTWSIRPHYRGKGTLDPMSMVLTVMPLCGMCLSCVFLRLFCPRQIFCWGGTLGAEVLNNKINTGFVSQSRDAVKVYKLYIYIYSSLGIEDL